MSKLESASAESPQESPAEGLAGERSTVTCFTASHTILFEQSDERCSVCDETLETEDEDGTEVRGRGLLVWTRGEERRYEEPHLCPSCASAIGVSALQRWEIEEDEG
ncbi:MAG TPA: hypothetical protein VM925_05655 [Labilithrix sp.]|nr:hypothetical protein [Labilithrix sp.]